MTLLYVTSFNSKLFNATGHNLVKSFIETDSEGILLLTYDEYPIRIGTLVENIIQYKLSTSQWLQNFWKENPDIISPIPCKCNNDSINLSKVRFHKKGCHFTYWNRYLYRWIHKIAALEYVINTLLYKDIVWLDCDCFFLERTTEKFILEQFKGTDTFYFKGPRREVEETGIVGYRNADFIKTYINRYTLGLFRNDPRWDDCYQYQMARKETKVSSIDLGRHCVTTDPIPESHFGQYISHKKGSHNRLGVV
jgi:hypothetical protein